MLSTRSYKVKKDDGKDFMLAELDSIRDRIMYTRNQFESAVNTYFTGMGILTTGVILLLSALKSSPFTIPLIIVFGIVTWGLSFYTYRRLCSNRVRHIREALLERRLQEYFLSKNSEFRKYANLEVSAAKIEEWPELPGVGLSRFLVVFFILFAIGISALTSVVTTLIVGMLLKTSGIPIWNYDSFHFLWYMLTAILSFAIMFVFCIRVLSSNRRDSKKLGREIFGQFHS
jgi:hypothetical protein